MHIIFSVIDIIYKINQKIQGYRRIHTSEIRINFKLMVVMLIWEFLFTSKR